MRLRSFAGQAERMTPAWCIAWSEVAEDAGFELARACTQHAFQVWASAFVTGRGRP